MSNQNTKKMNFAEKRNNNRFESTLSTKVRKSLQTCSVNENLEKLEGLLIFHKKCPGKSRALEGLLYILRQLLAKCDRDKTYGYLPYEDAYGIYCDFVQRQVEDKEFRDHLLHNEHGLCVYVTTLFGKRFIILQNDTVDLSNFLCELERLESDDKESFSRFDLNADTLKRVLQSMDTEYDKTVLKAVIFATSSRRKVYELGIKPENAVHFLAKTVYASKECEDAVIAAGKTIREMDKERLEQLNEKIEAIEKKLNKKESLMSEGRIADLLADKESLEERSKHIQEDMLQVDSKSKQRFQQRKRRIALASVKERRVKRRKLGAGASKSLDTEDEEFIAKCIEETSSAHGRRHDTVLYAGHRVKKSHFLSLANHNLFRRGKRLIKSATTVLNRARPKCVRSRAAKLHCGKSLFCSRKPPKTELHSTISTHHQRAHIRNVKHDMFKPRNKNQSLIISFDDKAYLRPGTDVGVRDVKKGVIFDVADQQKQKQLPQHDFSEPRVHQTPSSFRFIRGNVEKIGEEQRFVHTEDQTVVTIRPKYFIGSSGSVWASDLLKIKWEIPQLFEQAVQTNVEHTYALPVRKLCRRVHDILFYFRDCTPKSDVLCTSNEPDCPFRQYEEEKLIWLQTQLSSAESVWNEDTTSLSCTEDISKGNQLLEQVQSIKEASEEISATSTDPVEFWSQIESILELSDKTLQFINQLHLPPLYNYILEATDAGPGVGVSNVEVKYRDIEMARINGWTHLNRVHRAPHDSGQNEAERSNAAVGEALVTGQAIKWNYFQATDGLSNEQVDLLSVAEVKKLEEQAVERNAWRISHDIATRIDGEPGPAGDCMKALVTSNVANQFFFNTKYLHAYSSANSANLKSQVPGHNYFSKLDDVNITSMSSGEMYQEYRADESLVCTPRPFPDVSKLPELHYLLPDKTPLVNSEGMEREPDDYHPRAQLKKLHKENRISSDDSDAVTCFSQSYAVNENEVIDYLHHLQHLVLMSEKRKSEKQAKNARENEMTCDEFDWFTMLKDGTLSKQRVDILNKYIDKHKLTVPKKSKKQTKVDAIALHLRVGLNSPFEIAVEKYNSRQEANEIGDYSSDEQNESTNEDIVLQEIGETTSEDSS